MSRSRQLSTEEKEALVRRMEAGERVGALATETGVLRKSLHQWRAAWRAMGVAGLNRKRGPKPGGRQQADLDFFREGYGDTLLNPQSLASRLGPAAPGAGIEAVEERGRAQRVADRFRRA